MRKIIGISISIASEKTGIHPQTLRDYERKGLIVPLRTPGGARRYRDEELTRLARIQELTGMGLSLAGVEYVLQLEQAMQQLQIAHDAKEARVKELAAILRTHGLI